MKWLLLILLYMLPQAASAQLEHIHSQITNLLEGKRLKAGIALCDLSTGDSLIIRGNERFPMQSVFKFPIALTLLQEVDAGRRTLSDSLYVRKLDLPTGTWSPLRERYPEGEIYLSLAKLIQYTVSQSDNNGCDILLQLVGGAPRIENDLRRLGITDIAISKNEAEMHLSWEAQFANHATPQAMLQLLKLFAQQRLLEPATQQFLWQTMAATTTGSVRSKLPAEAVVAHKTGSSGRNTDGISAATNDAGILCLPDGRQVAYVVFITDSAESDAVNYGIIADIAHLLYFDYPNTFAHE